MEIELMDQIQEYASAPLAIESDDAVFSIKTAMASEHGQNALYYSSKDKKVYKTFNFAAPSSGYNLGSSSLADPIAGSKFTMTANVVPIEDGRQIHVKKDGSGNYEGYDAAFEDVHLFFDGAELTDAYAITLKNVDPVAEGASFTDYAKLYIVPRTVRLTLGYTQAKEYDGTTLVHVSKEGLAKAGVLNAEVAMKDDPGLDYQNANVNTAYADAYYLNDSHYITTNASTKLIKDVTKFGFQGTQIYLDDYIIADEDYYAIILPKKVTVTATDAIKEYDGQKLVVNSTNIPVEYYSEDNDGNPQSTLEDCLRGGTVSGNFFVFNGGDEVVRGPDVTFDETTHEPKIETFTIAANTSGYTILDANHNDITANFEFTFDDDIDIGITRRIIQYHAAVADRKYDGTNLIYVDTTIDAGMDPMHYAETGVTRENEAGPEMICLTHFNEAIYWHPHVEYNHDYPLTDEEGNVSKDINGNDVINRQDIRIYLYTDENSVKRYSSHFPADSFPTPIYYVSDYTDNGITWATINGANIANYKIEMHVGSGIYPRPISVDFINGVKDYDGTTNLVVNTDDHNSYGFVAAVIDDQTGKPTTDTGLLPQDVSLRLSGTGGTSTQRNATTGEITDSTSWSTLTLLDGNDGTLATDYAIPKKKDFSSSNIDIDPRPIKLYFHAVKTYDGTTNVKYLHFGALDTDTNTPLLTEPDYTYTGTGWRYILTTTVKDDSNSADTRVADKFYVTVESAQYSSSAATHNPYRKDWNTALPTLTTSGQSALAYTVASADNTSNPANYIMTPYTTGIIGRRPLTVEIDDQEIAYGDNLSLDNTYVLKSHDGFVEQRMKVGADYHNGHIDLNLDFDHIRAKVLTEQYCQLTAANSDAAALYHLNHPDGNLRVPDKDTSELFYHCNGDGSGNKFNTFDGDVELEAGTYVFFVNVSQKVSLHQDPQNPETYIQTDWSGFKMSLYGGGQVLLQLTDSDRGDFEDQGKHYAYNWIARQVNVGTAGTYHLHYDFYSPEDGYLFEVGYAKDKAVADVGTDYYNPNLTGFTALYATPGEVVVPPAMGGTVTPAYQYGQFNYEGNVQDTYHGITWAPAANNVLNGLIADVITEGDPTNPDGNRPDWDVSAHGAASVLTDGQIVGDKDGLEDANVYGVSNNMVIAWTLPSPETIEAFRFYTIDEGEGGIAQQAQKININIESIQVQHSDNTWETIQGSNFYYTHGWGDLDAKKTHQLDNNAYRPYIWLYNLNEGPLAVDVCAIKVNFGTFEANSTRFAEIEALRPTGSAGGIVNELYANDIFEVTLGSDTTKTTAQSSSGFLPVGEYPDALIMESYSIVDANTQSVAGNYVVDSDKGSIIVTQRVATVTVDGTKFWKVYDGTTAVRPIDENSALGNTITGDEISIAGSFAYDNANIGTGHTITMSGITKSGSDSGNYTVPGTATGENAVIDTLYITDPAKTPILIGSTWLNNNIPIYANTAYATNPNILHDVVEAINVTNSNGVTAWQSYVLGFNDKSGMLWIDTEQYNDTTKILAHYNTLAPVAASGYTPKFALVTREKAGGYSESVGGIQAANTKFDIATGSNDPTGHYEINAYFYSNNGNLKYLGMTDDQKAAIKDADENLAYCKSVNTLGILKAASTNHQEMIAIPWKQLAPNDEQSILVSNIVQTANLSEGDQLYVYRPNEEIPAGVPTSLEGGYNLVWNDEFNYTGAPDPQKWNQETVSENTKYGTVISRAKNAYCENGYLVLKHEVDGQVRYTGALNSYGKMSMKRGKVVIGFKAELCPALRTDLGLFGVAGDVSQTISGFNYYHDNWGGDDSDNTIRWYQWFMPADNKDEWIEDAQILIPATEKGDAIDSVAQTAWESSDHVLVIDWDYDSDGDQIKFMLDAKAGLSDQLKAGVDIPSYIVLKYFIDNEPGDAWEKSALGTGTHYIKIDYVRVYQKADGHSTITSCLSDTDGVYDCYLLDAQKKWSSITSYKLDENGKVTTRTATAPEYARIPRGSAVWLKRADASAPIYFAGQVNTNETVTTTVEQGSVSAPKWTMLGSPSINEPFDIATITEGVVATTSASQFMDQIVVHRDGVDKIYVYDSTKGWGYYDTETYTLWGKQMSRSVFKTDDTVVPRGIAFWYVSRGGSPTITWKNVVPASEESSGEGGSGAGE